MKNERELQKVTVRFTTPMKFEYEDPFSYYNLKGEVFSDSCFIDHESNPNHPVAVKHKDFFFSLYYSGDLTRDIKNNDSRKYNDVSELIKDFDYALFQNLEKGQDDENFFVEQSFYTSAKGIHFEIILNALRKRVGSLVSADIQKSATAFKFYTSWDFDQKSLEEYCYHEKLETLSVMNDKDGTIVQILKCLDCGEILKKPVRSY